MKRVNEEFETLLMDWESGELNDSDTARLQEILRSDPEARQYFAQWQMLSAAMKVEADTGVGMPSEMPPTKPSGGAATHPVIKSLRISYWIAAAITLLIVAMAGRLLQLEIKSQRAVKLPQVGGVLNPSAEATATGVALLTRLVDVEWSDEQQPFDVGDALPPGRVAIKSGYAQVEFFCGATVILEGPAELELSSPTLARVINGRLRAQVPPAARGFSLEVDKMKVVDLGTEFGLSVSPEGADIQVFDGEVELHQADSQTRLLKAGQAVKRSNTGEYQEQQTTPEEFVNIDDLESRAKGQRNQRFERWLKWSKKMRKDERLIAYYALEQNDSWKRKLESSIEPANRELDGAIVGARRVSGRWGAKSGLEFKQPGDRVRVQIPGEYSSLTFACWVKIDSLDRWYNSLFLTDGYEKGEPHWQILDTGRLFFSVRVSQRGEKGAPHRPVISEPFWEPSMSGKWLHLATTLNVESKTVTHYLNGKVLSQEIVPDAQVAATTRIGKASIGNWTLPTRPDAHFAIRNLNGSIDEFALFSAALSADEIREMYKNGKP